MTAWQSRRSEAAFLVSLKSVVGETYASPEREAADIVVDTAAGERVDAAGVIHLREVTPERLLVVADVLAKSVVLVFHFRQKIPKRG